MPLDRQPLDVLAALQHTGHSAQRLLGGVAEGVRAASEQVSWSVIWISAITLKRMCHLEPPSPPPPRAAAAAAATGAQSRDGDTPLVDEPLDDALGTLRRQLDAPRGLDAHLDRRAGKHQVGDADQGRHVDVLDDSGAGLMARGGARAARGG